MVLEDFYNMTLKEILDKYCVIHNLECGYVYGICEFDEVEELFDEYNIEEEYPEAFHVENIVNDEVMLSFDDDLLDYARLVKIMNNLGINKKKY